MGFRIVFACDRESGVGVSFLSALWCSSGGLASIFRRTNGEPVSARVVFRSRKGRLCFLGSRGERIFERSYVSEKL